MNRIWIRGRERKALKEEVKVNLKVFKRGVDFDEGTDSILTGIIGGDVNGIAQKFVIGRVRYWSKPNSDLTFPCVEVSGITTYPQTVLLTPDSELSIRNENGKSYQWSNMHKIGLLGHANSPLVYRAFLTYHYAPSAGDMIRKVIDRDERLLIIE